MQCSKSAVFAVSAALLAAPAAVRGDANWPGSETDAYWEDVWGNVNNYYVFRDIPEATVRFRSYTTLPSNRPVWFDGSHVTFIGDDSSCGIQAGKNWNVSLTVGRDRGAGYLTRKEGRYTFTDVAYIGIGNGKDSKDAFGELRLEGGTVSVTACDIAAGTSGSTGAILMSGGQFNFSGNVVIGRKGNGRFEVSGGDVVASREMNIGGESTSGDTGTGTLVIKGGTVTVNSYSSIGRTSTGTLILDGGSFVGKNDVDLGRWAGADGTLDVSNGTFTAEKNIVIGRDPGRGTINLCGGVVECNQISVGNSGTGALNLDGGTLKARSNQATYIQNSNNLAVKIGAKGAMFDTAGYAVTVPATLGNADVLVGNGQNGQIGKKGNGTLTLSSSLDLERTFKFVIDGGVGPIALTGPANTLSEGGKISVAIDPVQAEINTQYTLLTGIDTSYTKEDNFDLPSNNGFYKYTWSLESGTLSVSLAYSENTPVTARYGSDAWKCYNGNNTLIENAEPLAWTTYIFTGVEPAGDLETIGAGHKVVLEAAKDGDAGVTNTLSVASVANAKDVTVTTEEGCAVRLQATEAAPLSAKTLTNNGTLILSGTISIPNLVIGGEGTLVAEEDATVSIGTTLAQNLVVAEGARVELAQAQSISAAISGAGTLALSGGTYRGLRQSLLTKFTGVLELGSGVTLEPTLENDVFVPSTSSMTIRMMGATIYGGTASGSHIQCHIDVAEGTINRIWANNANLSIGSLTGKGQLTCETTSYRGPYFIGDNREFEGMVYLRGSLSAPPTGFYGNNAGSAKATWILDTNGNTYRDGMMTYAIMDQNVNGDPIQFGVLRQTGPTAYIRAGSTKQYRHGMKIEVGAVAGGESVIEGRFDCSRVNLTKVGADSWLTIGTNFHLVDGSTFNVSAGGLAFNLPTDDTVTDLTGDTVKIDPSVKIRVAMTQAQYEALDLDEEYLVAKLPSNPDYVPETELLVDGTVLDTSAAAKWGVRFKSFPAVDEAPEYVGAVLRRKSSGLIILVW